MWVLTENDELINLDHFKSVEAVRNAEDNRTWNVYVREPDGVYSYALVKGLETRDEAVEFIYRLAKCAIHYQRILDSRRLLLAVQESKQEYLKKQKGEEARKGVD